MINIDELERQASLATRDATIDVNRDELLFLINRYRELPDLTPEEAAETEPILGLRPDSGDDLAKQRCRSELRRAKRSLEQNRYSFALFADCPDCHVKAGEGCLITGHEARITAAFAALRKLKGSCYGEIV
jgi:hypothetical protein